jgi:hypothetical protein
MRLASAGQDAANAVGSRNQYHLMTVAHMFSLDRRHDTSSGTGTMEYRHVDDVIMVCAQYERNICTLMDKSEKIFTS